MAVPGITYTFVGGTAAIAAQVNTNFSNVINAITDGTADLTFSTLTAKTSVIIEDAGAGTNKVTIQAPTGLASSYTTYTASTITKTNTDYSVLTTDGFTTILFSTGNTTRTVTLPDAALNIYRQLIIAKTDSGTGYVQFATTSSQTINGLTATNTRLCDLNDNLSLQSDGSNWIVISARAGISRIRDEIGAGHGSTNTRIRRIETNVLNSGNAITRAVSATNGNSYTINQSGKYAINYSDRRTGSGADVGISLNSSQLTTNIRLITTTDRLAVNVSNSANEGPFCSVTLNLVVGDVIRPHTDATPDNTANDTAFEIDKISI